MPGLLHGADHCLRGGYGYLLPMTPVPMRPVRAYITGKAVEKACRKLQEKICEKSGIHAGECEVDAVEFDGHTAVDRATGKQVDLKRNRAQPDRAAMQEVFR